MQTNSFLQKFYSPNILAVASSLVGEDSLSHHVDPAIGVYIIDRYTWFLVALVSTIHNSHGWQLALRKTPMLLLMLVEPLD